MAPSLLKFSMRRHIILERKEMSMELYQKDLADVVGWISILSNML